MSSVSYMVRKRTDWLYFGEAAKIDETKIVDRTFRVTVNIAGGKSERRVGKVLGAIIDAEGKFPELLTTVGTFKSVGHIWMLEDSAGNPGPVATFEFEEVKVFMPVAESAAAQLLATPV